MPVSFVGMQLLNSVQNFVCMNEVQDVLNGIIQQIELEANNNLLRNTRSEVKNVRDELLKAHGVIASLEEKNNMLIRARREDKFEARVLKNRLQSEILDVITKLKEGKKYKEEVQLLKQKLKRKDKW